MQLGMLWDPQIANIQITSVINPFGCVARVFWEIYVNTIAADAQAPDVARSSAAMVLTRWDK